MIFFVTPDTVRRPARLRLTRVAVPMLGRGFRVVPRRPLRQRVFWRLLFDQAPMRYAIALSPFPIAILLRPDLALAISQAPLLMFAIVFMVESSVLSIQTPDKRRRLIDEDAAARGLDQLRLRAEAALGRLAADRGRTEGRLSLVVEQSGLARVPILTLFSVQEPQEGAPPILWSLSPEERAAIAGHLFDAEFDERRLHLINLRDNRFVREVPFEMAAVSAHARLMALARQRDA